VAVGSTTARDHPGLAFWMEPCGTDQGRARAYHLSQHPFNPNSEMRRHSSVPKMRF
jgi:hypothetical protein